MVNHLDEIGILAIAAALIVWSIQGYLKARTAKVSHGQAVFTHADADSLKQNIDTTCLERRAADKESAEKDVSAVKLEVFGKLDLVTEKFDKAEERHTETLRRLEVGDVEFQQLRESVRGIALTVGEIAKSVK